MSRRAPILAAVHALILLLLVCPAVTGQDVDAMVAEAVSLYERGQEDAALAKLKEVLAASPSSEDAFRLFNKIEFRKWARMLAEEGEIGRVVMELMQLGRPAEKQKVADKETIEGLIAKLDAEDWGERMGAFRQLAADHGEYAVPYLVPRLGSEDAMRRAATMAWLRRLGVQAVLPLIQSLEIGNERVQAAAVTVLGQIGDRRAAPYVLRATQAEGTLGDMARKAARQMGISGDLQQAMLGLAEAYYRREVGVVDPFRGLYAVWRCLDGETLVAHEVPRDTYHLKLAEEVLFDALALNADDRDTRVLLTSVLLAETAGHKPGSGDAGAEPGAPLVNARVMAGVQGASILDDVVKKALQDGRPQVAASAARMLGTMLTADTFSAPNALTDALSSPNKSVRFAAARAIAHIRPRTDFPGSESVVAVLAEALGQSIVRTALVIDDVAGTRRAIQGGLNGKGWFASGVAYGSYGLERLRAWPIEDLVIIRYNLQDQSVNQVVKMIKEDDRTAETPIFMLCSEAQLEEAKGNYEDKVAGFITAGSAVDSYEPGLAEKLPDLDESRAAADEIAAAAARALAHMDPQAPFMASGGAREALQGVLLRSDAVRIPAMIALGAIGNPDSVSAMLPVFGDTSASEEVRGAAAVAMARCARTAGEVSQELRAALVEAIKGEGSLPFMMHLAQAIGSAPFGAAERAQLLRDLRGRIKVDTVE